MEASPESPEPRATDDDLIFVNGLNATYGGYIDDPLSRQEFADFARDEDGRRSAAEKAAAGDKNYRAEGSYAIETGLDPTKLEEAGWAVVYPTNVLPEIKAALKGLVDHRKDQGGDLVREFSYVPKESYDSFRARYHISTGQADPEEMPYYVLLVGDPETIPYEFQHTLDLDRAVGRLFLGKSGDPATDSPADYEQYAQSVIQAETKLRLPRRAAFFATANDNDVATGRSNSELVDPLVKRLSTDRAVAGWELSRIQPDDATKDCLARLLGGPDTPSLLFTATHGAGFDASDPLQSRRQGALVTQDWPGHRDQPLIPDYYFSADDLIDMGNSAHVWGLIAVLFACFGAGTPAQSSFYHLRARDRREKLNLADHAMVSPLPQTLLAHGNGGALAVVGHVERAWPDSFRIIGRAGDEGSDTKAMRNLLRLLMRGYPLGLAMEDINSRYASFSTQLTSQLYEAEKTPGLLDLPEVRVKVSGLWTATNDARNYVILGDPAVRLPLTDPVTTSRTEFEFVPVHG